MGANINSNFQKCGNILIDIKTLKSQDKSYAIICGLCNAEYDKIKIFSQHLEEKHSNDFVSEIHQAAEPGNSTLLTVEQETIKIEEQIDANDIKSEKLESLFTLKEVYQNPLDSGPSREAVNRDEIDGPPIKKEHRDVFDEDEEYWDPQYNKRFHNPMSYSDEDMDTYQKTNHYTNEKEYHLNDETSRNSKNFEEKQGWTKMGSPAQNTRKRAKNYSAEEELLLVELVLAHKDTLENKKSDAVVWRQKEEAWRKIAAEFSAKIGSSRQWKSLREKYEAIKRKSKTEMAAHKLETYRTGGGVASTNVSTVSAKIASLLGYSVTGAENMFDSDSLDLESSIEGIEPKQMDSDKFSKAKISMEEKTDWSNWRPASLKKSKSQELLFSTKRGRNLEEEKIELIILQQKFYRDENRRAQEKHEQELLSLKLKNEILRLKLAEKKLQNSFN